MIYLVYVNRNRIKFEIDTGTYESILLGIIISLGIIWMVGY